MYSERYAVASAVFTRNRVQSASVKLSRECLQDAKARAIIINSGNANTCTGARGYRDAKIITEAVSRELGIGSRDVLIASTGVIGRFLPVDRVKSEMGRVAKNLSKKGNISAARAIMTTDTFPKEKAVKFNLAGREVVIGAMGKGAGMICPSMATMLCFITTDALIARDALEKALKDSVDKSFNRITVDGDMSTNDSVFILANGVANNEEIRVRTGPFVKFQEALSYVTCEISRMIVKDAEGGKKSVEVKVVGARSEQDAKKVAFKIANSSLVKAALGGESPNWGRIASAAGSAGADLEEDKMSILIGNVKVMKNGCRMNYDVGRVKKVLKCDEVKISIDLGLGTRNYVVWTSDLTEEYVKINA